jgi:cytochrome c6
MFRTTTKISFALLAAACFLAGCSKNDAPRKAGSFRTASVTPQAALNRPEQIQTGEALFKQFCSSCHPDGNNVSDPKRTLHGDVLRKNHINTAEDIVKIMRNPMSRMIRFDVTTISDSDAQIVADYVLRTFR